MTVTKTYLSVLVCATLAVILIGTILTLGFVGSEKFVHASVVELADTLVLEASAVRHGSSTLPARTIPYTYKDIATSIAKEEGLDPDLFHALIDQESKWNPTAVSKMNAYGLTQLMSRTAKELGVNRFQPVENLAGGARYLRQQLEAHRGNVLLALYAYNGGAGNVKRGRINREMRQYASAILSDLE